MRDETKILVIWLLLLSSILITLFYPHREIEPIAILNTALQLLLFLLSIWIAFISRTNQRFVFLNFSFLFGYSILLFSSSLLIGTILFNGTPYATVYYHTYINKIGLCVTFFISIFYAIVDDIIPQWLPFLKFGAVILVVALITIILFYPYMNDPLSLYSESDYMSLQQINTVHKSFLDKFNHVPDDKEIAMEILQFDQSSGSKESIRDFVQTTSMVTRLRPFLSNGGATAIFWKPLNLRAIYANLIILGSIALFLLHIYKTRKPHTAYIDKILILLFIFCLLDTIHTYGYIYSKSAEDYRNIFIIGQYITVACLLVMVYTFGLKYRFVCSATGMYYEKLLAESPEKVTRWRDELDNLILKIFFIKGKYSHRVGQIAKLPDTARKVKKNDDN